MAFPFTLNLHSSYMVQVPWIPLGHSLYFSANSSDLVYMVHPTRLWSPSLHLLRHSSSALPPLPCTPLFVKPTPARPHKAFPVGLGEPELNSTLGRRLIWHQRIGQTGGSGLAGRLLQNVRACTQTEQGVEKKSMTGESRPLALVVRLSGELFEMAEVLSQGVTE